MMLMPNTATTNQIQRSYRQVFDTAKTAGPVVVLTNNKPDVVILSPEDFDRFYKTQEEWEIADTLEAVNVYREEKRTGSLIKNKTLIDLM